jgi:hypothetical protein
MQELDNGAIKLITIARRQWRGGGTRYHARGLSEKGDVSNYTEIE